MTLVISSNLSPQTAASQPWPQPVCPGVEGSTTAARTRLYQGFTGYALHAGSCRARVMIGGLGLINKDEREAWFM